MTFKQLKAEAFNIMMDARRAQVVHEDVMLMPHTSDRGIPSNPTLVRQVAEIEDLHTGPGKDKRNMEDFLDNIDPDTLNIPAGYKRGKLITAGVPLIDFCRAYSCKSDAWIFPSVDELDYWSRRRAMSWTMDEEVEVLLPYFLNDVFEVVQINFWPQDYSIARRTKMNS